MAERLPLAGLRHLALMVSNWDASVDFYTRILGMQIEWQPDADNVYLSSGCDNLALHRLPSHATVAPTQRLDHLGFIIASIELVEQWHTFLQTEHVKIKAAPRQHRDGTYSFYCFDPDDNTVQLIYHPLLVPLLAQDPR